MATDIVKALSKEEAQALTTRIKTSVESLWQLLTEARDRRAWEVLGYASWAEYVRMEFDMTRQRSHQLLNQGVVIHRLSEAAGLSTTVDTPTIPEGQTRTITPEILPQVVAEVRHAVETGTPPVEAIQTTVQHFAEAHREAEREIIASDALPDVRRVYEAVTRMKQGWNVEDIGPAINRVYGAKDVGHVLDELTKSIEYLSEATRYLRDYLERS